METKSKAALSVYIHIPFCSSKCAYCDFNSYAGAENLIPAYMQAVEKEINHFSNALTEPYYVHTIYFGGGTPSIIPAELLERTLSVIKTQFNVTGDAETTIEMNPNGVMRDYLEKLYSIGINRLSIGMQSAVENELAMLGRRHRQDDVVRCVSSARSAGFENINLDLMFGLPTQTMKSLKTSVSQAIDLNPEHLSIYGLSLHEGTPMANQISSGTLPGVDEDLAGDMYQWIMEALPESGYEQYEISNWAKEEKYQSRHNLQYWHNYDYLGIGAGAHSYVLGKRWYNVNLINDYISMINHSGDEGGFAHDAIIEIHELEKIDVIKETMMMGLRLTEEGVNLDTFKNRFDADIAEIYTEPIRRLTSFGLLEYAGNGKDKCLRLTVRGRMLGNQVFMAFI